MLVCPEIPEPQVAMEIQARPALNLVNLDLKVLLEPLASMVNAFIVR